MFRCAAMLLWSTDQQVTHGFFILPSSFKAQFAVNSHSLYRYFRWYSNGSFTKTCVLATTSNVAFLSGVKCPFNELKTNIPCFLRTAHDLLSHINNSLLVSHSLVWNLTAIQQDSCWLSTVLQFTILYGGRLLPADTPTNRLTSLYYLKFYSPQGASLCNSKYLMSYQNTMVLLQHLLCGSVCNSSSFAVQSLIAETNKLQLKACEKYQEKERENTFLCIMTKYRFVLALNWYHVLYELTRFPAPRVHIDTSCPLTVPRAV